jgi:hypothetical protein
VLAPERCLALLGGTNETRYRFVRNLGQRAG